MARRFLLLPALGFLAAGLPAQAPLSQGRPCTASNHWREDPRFTGDKAVDGDLETRWATDGGEEPRLLTVDLGEPRTVSFVRVRECVDWGARVKEWRLEYQDDKERWRVVFEATSMGRDYLRPFPPVTARFWRLVITGGEAPTIWEFQLFAPGTEPDLAAEAAREVAALQPRIHTAIERGVAWLLTTQNRDGSWTCQNRLYPNGQTALSLYTLVKCGLPPGHQAIRRGIAFLEGRLPGETYSAGCELLFWDALGDPARRERMEQVLDLLLSWQQEDGFSYPWVHAGDHWVEDEFRGDLSNMQYAALGLRAAAHSGLDVPNRAWKALLHATLTYQKPLEQIRGQAPVVVGPSATSSPVWKVAGFGYSHQSWHSYPTGAMTAAGLAILRICADGLGERYTGLIRQKGEAAQGAALAWLAWQFRPESNPGQNAWPYYYLYGIERVGSLLDREFLGNRPWYLEGARHLLARQTGGGGWPGGGTTDEASTCFALLFLKRATRHGTTGEDLGVARTSAWASPEEAPVDLRATGTARLTAWIQDLRPPAPAGAEPPVEPGAGLAPAESAAGLTGEPPALHVRQVDYLLDGVLRATVPGRPSVPWSGERFPVQLEIGDPGAHLLEAVVHVQDPDGGLRELRSGPVEVRLSDVVAPWMETAARLRTLNRVPDFVRAVAASTEGTGARLAADGLETSGWQCLSDDGDPWLEIELVRPLRATRVVLCQRNPQPRWRGHYDRITSVEIYVNRSREPVTASLPADELEPALVDLGKEFRVRQLRVRITGRERGRIHPGVAGFTEVGLLR